MSNEQQLVPGSLVVTGLVDAESFSSVQELIEALPRILAVQVPKSVTNVHISNTQPLDRERDVVWFRLDNAGVFQGIYIFTDGVWAQMFPAPQSVIRMYGDSRSVPKGYLLADENNAQLPPGVGQFLKNYWKPDPTGAYYVLFDVTFVGA